MANAFTQLILIVLLLASCGSKREPEFQKVTFSEFVQRTKSLSTETTIEVEGVFDFKVPCLNFQPHYNPTGECEMHFSESAGTNARSVVVALQVCGGKSNRNCIDPLLKNAPPETVIVRDRNGTPIEPWSKVGVAIRSERINNRANHTVIEIY